jgi:hypothetical protein
MLSIAHPMRLVRGRRKQRTEGVTVPDLPKEHVYRPIWFFIYCSDGRIKETTKGKLGAEHIIPFGLGSVMILPRASCKKCGKITGKIEESCLRMMLGPTRIRMSLPTRNPDDLPTDAHHSSSRWPDRAKENPRLRISFGHPRIEVARTGNFEWQ